MKKNITRAVIVGNVAVIAITLLIYALGVLKVLSNNVVDYSQQWSMTHQPHEDIIVVAIDDDSIKEIGAFPFDRTTYIPFIKFVEASGAKAIAFDVTFGTPSNPESDKALAEELARHNNIIIPSYADLESDFKRSTKVKKNEMIMARGLEKPIEVFAKASNNAHVNRTVDEDGIIRRNWLQINTPEGIVSSLAFKAALVADKKVEHFPDYHPQTEIIIDYQANSNDFMTIPFAKVLKGDLPKDTFKDRIVLIGYTAPGFDEGITPIEKSMSLVYAHANILSQLLTDKYIFHADKWLSLLLIGLMMLVIGYITWRVKSIITVTLVFGITLALLGLQYYLFATGGMILDVVNPIAGAFIAFFVNIAIKTFYETKQKNYITKQFGRYISPDLVQEIAKSGQELKLGGVNRELTILFLDIRGFTPLSEKLPPEEVVDFLNMMFDLITRKTLENKGTVDKFIGDAAMLLFNAPLDVPDHEYYAVKTAYDIQQGMVKVREDIFEKHGVKISVGIGINSGKVVVGNIGSYLRVDYTAIGDNVNTAARIESNTQPNQILVSESTYEKTKEYFDYNCVGEKTVKGKSVPLILYEVLGVNKEL